MCSALPRPFPALLQDVRGLARAIRRFRLTNCAVEEQLAACDLRGLLQEVYRQWHLAPTPHRSGSLGATLLYADRLLVTPGYG